MATQVITVLVDDLDGSAAVVTRRITVDGRSVRVDLNAEHSARLDAALAPFLAVGAPEPAGAAAAGDGAGDPAAGGAAAESGRPGPRLPTIRGWARANGFDLKERGRIPAEVLRAYADHVTR